METAIYSTEGKKTGTINLAENVFGVSWTADLVKQVADSLLSSKRKNVAHTIDRSDVRGGGKKPWQQKGTAVEESWSAEFAESSLDWASLYLTSLMRN